MNSTKDLGRITNIEVIQKFVSIDGRMVVDAGCGGMTFTRLLVELGAQVLAVDPDPIRAEQNRAAEPVANVQFVETGAEQLPVEDRTIDGVFFAYSLHHVPSSLYPQVFAEVFRVLRPDGFLYVIEPIDCPLNDVIKLFYNEDRERAAAQQALLEIATPGFHSVETVTYYGESQYESFQQFADHFASQSFNSLYSDADVRRPEVKEAFERLGGPEHRFCSPKQAVFFKGLNGID